MKGGNYIATTADWPGARIAELESAIGCTPWWVLHVGPEDVVVVRADEARASELPLVLPTADARGLLAKMDRLDVWDDLEESRSWARRPGWVPSIVILDRWIAGAWVEARKEAAS